MGLIINSPCFAQWSVTFGGSGIDYSTDIYRTQDGGNIVAGVTTSFGAGNYDGWILKLDSDGNVGPNYPGTWQKTYGGVNDDWARDICVTFDQYGNPDGYIMLGETRSYGSDLSQFSLLVLKINLDGSIAWQKVYGGTNADNGYSVQQTFDGGFIVGGFTGSFGHSWPNGDIWVLKLDSNGKVEWQKQYGDGGGDKAVKSNKFSIREILLDTWCMGIIKVVVPEELMMLGS